MTAHTTRPSLLAEAPSWHPTIGAAIIFTNALKGSGKRRTIFKTEILSLVSREMHIGIRDLTGPSRAHNIVRARNIYVALCLWFTSDTISSIAFSVSRDHSTILHGYARVQANREAYEPTLSKLATELTRLRQERLADPSQPLLTAPKTGCFHG